MRLSIAADLGGSGNGPLRGARPAVRLATGLILVIAVIISPRSFGWGVGSAVVITTIALLATGAPRRVIVRGLQFGLVIYLPLVVILLIPLLWGGGGVPRSGPPDGFEGIFGQALGQTLGHPLGAALMNAGSIALRGGAALLIAISTLTTIERSELHSAIAGLPLPLIVRLLLLQIVQQVGTLVGETIQIRRALTLRAPRRRGLGGVRVLVALPHLWLERVAKRAERVAMTLELRGYHLHGGVPHPLPPSWSSADTLALGGALLILVGGVGLHLIGV